MKEATTKIYNVNDENLASVRAYVENKAKEECGGNKVFTMVQRNAPCDVNITEESRNICAKTLTELR